MRRGLVGISVPVVLCAVTGCRPPRPPYPQALHAEAPADRISAIRRAADMRDQRVVGILVDRLADEDEGVRFYAILALERLTGTRLGYAYHAPERERLAAIERWRRYLADGRVPHTQSAESQP